MPRLSHRTAVFALFAVEGLAMAAWVSRVPALRDLLHLDPAGVGAMLVGASAGAIAGLLGSSHLLHWLGGRRTILVVLVAQALGLLVIGIGADVIGQFVAVFLGLAIFGASGSICDVAMNVEGTAVEHRADRTILPLMHAAWSLGTVAGAGIGSAAAFVGLPPVWHLGGMAVVMLLLTPVVVAGIPVHAAEEGENAAPRSSFRDRMSIWLEPRTLLIGALVLGMAFAEGSANDWLALAMIDDRGVDHGQGALLFAVFTAAMTIGRIVGTPLTDRLGRIAVIRGSAAFAIAGLLVVILVPVVWVDVIGIVLWGIGASLGFPLGMSAAADDPAKAAARVSAVATVGYFAFLVGPPVIGLLSDAFGSTLRALLLVVALVAMSLLASRAARETGARARS